MQQYLIDVLDACDFVQITGTNGNRTNLIVNLTELNDKNRETRFENCLADVNIPLGEVFTSPKLAGTNGILHVMLSNFWCWKSNYCKAGFLRRVISFC